MASVATRCFAGEQRFNQVAFDSSLILIVPDDTKHPGVPYWVMLCCVRGRSAKFGSSPILSMFLKF